MKKSLFLLPLLAGLALCGCNDDGEKDKEKEKEHEGEFEGLTLDYEAFSDIVGQMGYQSGEIEVDGYAVSYSDIMAKEYLDESYDSGDYQKCEEMLPVLQWKKSSAAISVSDVKPVKMTLTYITTYDAANIANVNFGGKSISGKKSGSGEKVGELEKSSSGKVTTFDVMRYSYVYDINAEEFNELEITNKTSYAQYVESIVLE